MRFFFFAAFAALSALPARAGTIPQYINYQGKLGDSSGNPLSGTYSFRFKLYNAVTGGTLLFTEDQTGANALSVVNGIYTAQIGSVTAGGISTAAFANAGVWLELDVNAGSNLTGAETLTPRERFAATPFAFRATAADFLGGGAVVSTFTSQGLMLFPFEVRAGSMSLTSGLTASSGSFTASGASQYSVRTTSGISVGAGGVVAPFFVGNGSALTGITAGALPANVAYTDAANAFSGLNTFSNTTRVNATLQVDGALATSNQAGLVISTPAYMNSGVAIGGAGGGEYGSITYGVTYGPATSDYRYRYSDTANHLQFNSGQYVFSNAPAGTVGNAITFTERMRLTAQGALGVGTNAPTNRLHVNGGLTASSGTFTLTGAVSVQTSSGINVSAGGVVAPFFVGNGSALTGITGTDATKVAKTGDTMTGQLTVSGATATVRATNAGGMAEVLSVTNADTGSQASSVALDFHTGYVGPAAPVAKIRGYVGNTGNNGGGLDILLRNGNGGGYTTGVSMTETLTSDEVLVGLGAAAPQTKLEVNGSAQFGSGVTKSTFSTTGALSLALNAALIGSSSITTTGAFFGDGSKLTGIPSTASISGGYVAKTGDTMTGTLNLNQTAISVYGQGVFRSSTTTLGHAALHVKDASNVDILKITQNRDIFVDAALKTTQSGITLSTHVIAGSGVGVALEYDSAHTIAIDDANKPGGTAQGWPLTLGAGPPTNNVAFPDYLGGNLVLKAGRCTGTCATSGTGANSSIYLQTPTPSGTSGTAYNAVTTKLGILPSGRVGIGDGFISPGARLEVKQAASDPYALQVSSNNGTGMFYVTREGKVGIGATASTNTFDLANAARSGNHPTGLSAYITGGMGDGGSGSATSNIEFRHSNASQGIGFGFNTIYATGDNPNQVLSLLSKGSNALILNSNAAAGWTWGNVGVGTASPAAKLDIALPAWSNYALQVSSTNGTAMMYMDKKGQLSLKAADPRATLHISSGTVGFLGVTTGLYIDGDVQTGLTVNSSRDSGTSVAGRFYLPAPTNSANAHYGVYSIVPVGASGGNGYSRAIYAETYNASAQSAGQAYAIHGRAGNAYTGYNGGVVGELAGSNYGAGVYGSVGAPTWALGAQYAGYFQGNVHITGTLTKGAGTFSIDHPLDPKNKILSHSFVESPDMKNLYDGIATLGPDGTTVVALPSYFEALNREFRYQLTPLGSAAPALFVATEISSGSFRIAGGAPGQRVSWQVTATRKDRYAENHRVVVEQEKGAGNGYKKGVYLHPEDWGLPKPSQDAAPAGLVP